MRKIVTSLLMVAFLSIVFGSNVTSAKEITVQKGDSLWKISQVHSTTIKSLMKTNNLSSTLIYPGQKLNTSAETTSSGVITVKTGDSLWKISQVHNTTIKSLMKNNNLSSHLIYPGQKLSIATATTSTNIASSKTASSKSSAAKEPSAKKELTVTATAYTASCSGCSGITATGIDLTENPNQKVIAVDPNVIPLGSKVYVEGYGTAIAGDTGGAIKGNRIDVFIPRTGDANKWGVKTVKVTILS